MRITAVEPLVVGTPWRELTYVRVLTDENIEGIGEVRMVNRTDAMLGLLDEALPRHVIGTDPFAIEELVRRFTRDDYARPDYVAMSALAGLEIACWDIVGKALGVPIHTLFGGAIRNRVKAYANGWYTVERTASEFHDAARHVVERGYRALKFDPFGSAFQELERSDLVRAVSLVEAVRDAVGPDVEILIEMHGRFTPTQAVQVVRSIEQFDPAWIEEPVTPHNVKGLAFVASRVDVPVATGERVHARAEFRELLEQQAVAILQPDITNCGGLLEARKIASWAESYDVLVAPHNVGGPVSTAAALHLAAVTPNFAIQEHFNDFADAHVKDVAPGGPSVVDGYFTIPQAPGLGVTIDLDVIRANPRGDINFNLYADDWHRRGTR